jgi:preprotein translocase subunit SecY
MNTFFDKLKRALEDRGIRNRLLFIVFALLVFRALAAIPVPGIDLLRLEQFFANNEFFGLLNLFAGGGLSNLSIVMLGVGPYITASIILQLMTVLFPRMKALYHEEGEAGRRKFNQYSRMLTVPLAAFQAFAYLTLLTRQGAIAPLSPFEIGINILVITAGSLLLMWIGELITEFGIGNGVSVLIFAGIIAGLPSIASQILFTYDPAQIPVYLAFLAATVLVILGVITVTESERPIPITYAKQSRGTVSYGNIPTYLPLRLNQAGVMPIIFALSILLFPQMLFGIFSGRSGFMGDLFTHYTAFTQNLLLYGIAYFLLVFFFTFFYTAVTFEPETVATNLQKSGAFIPGVRPGTTTNEYIGSIMTRVTFIGALFLGVIAVLPIAMQAATGIPSLALGGTALLIVVGVVTDITKRIDAQVAMREY